MNNKQKEKILENVKLKISISNFEKEEKIEMRKTSKSTLKIAAIACCVMLSITGVVFAKDIGNFVKEIFGGNASEGEVIIPEEVLNQTKEKAVTESRLYTDAMMTR